MPKRVHVCILFELQSLNNELSHVEDWQLLWSDSPALFGISAGPDNSGTSRAWMGTSSLILAWPFSGFLYESPSWWPNGDPRASRGTISLLWNGISSMPGSSRPQNL